jgi:hypothetical protein
MSVKMSTQTPISSLIEKDTHYYTPKLDRMPQKIYTYVILYLKRGPNSHALMHSCKSIASDGYLRQISYFSIPDSVILYNLNYERSREKLKRLANINFNTTQIKQTVISIKKTKPPVISLPSHKQPTSEMSTKLGSTRTIRPSKKNSLLTDSFCTQLDIFEKNFNQSSAHQKQKMHSSSICPIPHAVPGQALFLPPSSESSNNSFWSTEENWTPETDSTQALPYYEQEEQIRNNQHFQQPVWNYNPHHLTPSEFDRYTSQPYPSYNSQSMYEYFPINSSQEYQPLYIPPVFYWPNEKSHAAPVHQEECCYPSWIISEDSMIPLPCLFPSQPFQFFPTPNGVSLDRNLSEKFYETAPEYQEPFLNSLEHSIHRNRHKTFEGMHLSNTIFFSIASQTHLQRV